jgi:excisionase family DNA binding protein
MGEYKKLCNYCGKEFIAQKRTTRCCSDRCNKAAYKLRLREQKEIEFTDQETMKRLLFRIEGTIERLEQAISSIPKQWLQHEKDMLTAAEFCEVMQISRKTLDRMIEKGEVKPMRIGNKLFFARTEIKKLKTT